MRDGAEGRRGRGQGSRGRSQRQKGIFFLAGALGGVNPEC